MRRDCNSLQGAPSGCSVFGVSPGVVLVVGVVGLELAEDESAGSPASSRGGGVNAAGGLAIARMGVLFGGDVGELFTSVLLSMPKSS